MLVGTLDPPLNGGNSTSVSKSVVKKNPPFSNVLKSVVKKINTIADATIKGLAWIVTETDGVYQLARLGGSIITGVQHWGGKYCAYEKLRVGLDYTEGMTEFFGTFVDIEGFVSGESQKGTLAAVAAKVTLAFINFAGMFLLLDEVRLIDLGKAADAIGKLPIMSFVKHVALGTVVQGTLVIYHLLLTADAIIKIVTCNGEKEKILAWMELANGIVEIALKTFVLIGGTCVPTLVILGTVAAGTAIMAFLYEKSITTDNCIKIA